MRFRLLLLLLPFLLGACADVDAPVRLDFIGNTTLTSSNRTVSPNDTLTSRIYAQGENSPLRRLRITVTYKPGLTPFLYPVPLTSFDPKRDVTEKEQTILFLDSLIVPIPADPSGREYLFQNQFSARSTSGTELWQYTVYDSNGQSASRAYRLTARKADSAAVYHSYTKIIRPLVRTAAASDPFRDRARVFLNLRTGLLLPKFAVLNTATPGSDADVSANQQLVDVVGKIQGNRISLDALADTAQLRLLPLARWPLARRRATQLRRTTLTPEAFGKAATTEAFNAAFTAGTPFSDSPTSVSTGTLAKNQVIAFRVSEGTTAYTGLLLVTDVVLGTLPVLTCAVRVQK